MFISPVKYDFYQRRMPGVIAQFPVAFNKAFPQPLAIGIHKQLKERTGMSSKEVSCLLEIWTRRWEYRAMACSVGCRVDLDGNITLMDAVHRQGFIAGFKTLQEKQVRRFARAFYKAFNMPAFINVPIKERPEFSMELKSDVSETA